MSDQKDRDRCTGKTTRTILRGLLSAFEGKNTVVVCRSIVHAVQAAELAHRLAETLGWPHDAKAGGQRYAWHASLVFVAERHRTSGFHTVLYDLDEPNSTGDDLCGMEHKP